MGSIPIANFMTEIEMDDVLQVSVEVRTFYRVTIDRNFTDSVLTGKVEN